MLDPVHLESRFPYSFSTAYWKLIISPQINILAAHVLTAECSETLNSYSASHDN